LRRLASDVVIQPIFEACLDLHPSDSLIIHHIFWVCFVGLRGLEQAAPSL
jgi:hypothetical protein